MSDPIDQPSLPDADWAWEALAIAASDDEAEIRRAYVRRLKAIDPDTDPQAFITLREARDLAMYLVWRGRQEAAPPSAEGAAADVPAADQPPPLPAAPEPQVETRFQPADAQDDIDPELYARIERLLFGETAPDPGELHAAAAALLAHPGLDRIGAAESIQNWVVNMIVRSSPRSDAMLDLAISRFRWDEDRRDWRRPPVLDWILQRRHDAAFEHDLVRDFPQYEEVLRLLRTPGIAPPEAPGWRLADNVRAFLAYVRLHYPTTIALCDRDALAWWDADLAHPRGFLRRNFGGLVRSWYGRNAPDGIFQPRDRVIGLGHLLGVFILPFIFAWPMLRPGYPWIMRIFAFAWLSLVVVAFINAPPPSARDAYGPYRPAFGTGPSLSPDDDPAVALNPLLSRIGGSQLEMVSLETRNPRLHGLLVDRWREAAVNGEGSTEFEESIVRLLDDFYREGLRGAGSDLQADFWRLTADQLGWLRRYGGGYCERFIDEPNYGYRFPPDMLARRRELRRRVWLEAIEAPPPRRASVSIPGAVIAAAARRAHLSPEALNAALDHRGAPDANCGARIALIETVLALPPEGRARMLRDLSSLE